MSGTIASLVVGALIDSCGGHECEQLGVIMTLNTAVPCLIGSFCFFMAGKPYADSRCKLWMEKRIALVKADGMSVGLEVENPDVEDYLAAMEKINTNLGIVTRKTLEHRKSNISLRDSLISELS
jgi:hypothetical protein